MNLLSDRRRAITLRIWDTFTFSEPLDGRETGAGACGAGVEVVPAWAVGAAEDVAACEGAPPASAFSTSAITTRPLGPDPSTD